MEKELLRYKSYFDWDLTIKSQIYDLGTSRNLTNDEIIKYTDKLYDSVSKLQSEFFEICRLFDMSEDFFKAVYDFMEKIRERIVNTNYTNEDVKNIYNDCFASMSEKNLKEIRKNIYGDSTVYSEVEEWIVLDILKKCSSVNELLHFFHIYVTNNLDALRSIPEIVHKDSAGDAIILRGVDSKIGRQIYEAFDSRIDVGITDIVSIREDKVLIVVRDRGHALQIEIESKNDKEVGVYYFIPKVVIPEMFTGLKGINRLKPDDTFAFGSFISEKENVAIDVFELVKNVPTDSEYIAYRKSK